MISPALSSQSAVRCSVGPNGTAYLWKHFFWQQMFNGLTLGAVYGLIAIGYTMVYGIIGMINFAHGEVYMISAYLCAIGLALLSFFGVSSFPLLIFGTLVFTLVFTGVYGWVNHPG